MEAGVPGVSLDELVARFGGDLRGDGAARVSKVASLENGAEGEICYLANPRLKSQLADCRATAVIVSRKLADSLEGASGNYILVDNPHVHFARVAQWLHPRPMPTPGIHPSAVVESEVPASVTVGAGASIGPGVVLGERVIIGPGCHIGAGCRIGDESYLHAGVVVYPDCVIGRRAVIHSGAVIGADGFGFAREKDGSWVAVPQIGRVVMGDDVNIGANTTIDRGALDDTVIGDGVIIDNLVQIAHNIQIGRHTAIAGCTGIAGSAKIGERCMFGGATMIVGHLSICDDAVITGGTLISKSVTEPGVYTNSLPQQSQRDWLKNFSHIRHLDEMADRIRALEKRLAELGGKMETQS